jgi:hypothetical protein
MCLTTLLAQVLPGRASPAHVLYYRYHLLQQLVIRYQAVAAVASSRLDLCSAVTWKLSHCAGIRTQIRSLQAYSAAVAGKLRKPSLGCLAGTCQLPGGSATPYGADALVWG